MSRSTASAAGLLVEHPHRRPRRSGLRLPRAPPASGPPGRCAPLPRPRAFRPGRRRAFGRGRSPHRRAGFATAGPCRSAGGRRRRPAHGRSAPLPPGPDEPADLRQPRVTSAASVLCPNPSPETIPAAMATTFFRAPRARPRSGRRWCRSGRRRSRTDTGAPRARAASATGDHGRRRIAAGDAFGEVGPERAATGARGWYLLHDLGHPLEGIGLDALRRWTRSAASVRRAGTLAEAPASRRRDGQHERVGVLEALCGGPPSAAPPAGDRCPGAGWDAAAPGRCASTVSRSRPQSRTSWPARARWIASAVPQEPAPRIETFTCCPACALRRAPAASGFDGA